MSVLVAECRVSKHEAVMSHPGRTVDSVTKPTIRLTRADVQEILNHAHWMAAKNGAQARFMHSSYSGYSFPGLMKALVQSGCLVTSRTRGNQIGHFSGYQMRARLDSVEIPANEFDLD